MTDQTEERFIARIKSRIVTATKRVAETVQSSVTRIFSRKTVSDVGLYLRDTWFVGLSALGLFVLMGPVGSIPWVGAFLAAHSAVIGTALLWLAVFFAIGMNHVLYAIGWVLHKITSAALAIALSTWMVVVFATAFVSVVMMGAMLAVYKALWSVALALQTPSLMVTGNAKESWKLYGLSWAPKYFTCTTVGQVAARSTTADTIAESFVKDLVEPANVHHLAQQPKGRPTPKQVKSRPRKLPLDPATGTI